MLTPEQLELRRTGIGGTDIAPILKMSEWRTPLDIYNEKVGIKEEIDPESISEIRKQRYYALGNKVEPYLRKIYAEMTGFTIEHSEKMYRSEEHPFMIAHIDGFVKSENIVVEFKKVNKFMKKYWGEEGSDDIPIPYLSQCAHYSFIKPKRTDIVASFLDEVSEDIILNFDNEDIINHLLRKNLRIYHYYPHAALESNIVNIASDFWFNNVKALVPPPPSNPKEALALFPIDEEKTKVATEEEVKVIKRFEDIRKSIKSFQDTEKDYKTEIITLLQGASILLDDKGDKLLKSTFPHMLDEEMVKRMYPSEYNTCSSFDKSLLKENHPDIYRKCTVKSKTPTLRVA